MPEQEGTCGESEMDFIDVEPRSLRTVPTAMQVTSGIPVPPVLLVQVMSSDDWEQFTEEWLSFSKTAGAYAAIRRYSGSGDLGLDVVGFTGPHWFDEPWDSFQCKAYADPLTLGDVCGEIGKIIYHSFKRTPPFNRSYRVPRAHFFVAPRGVGISLGRLLTDPERLRDEIRAVWSSHCVPKIARGLSAPLEGDLGLYFDEFDFSIFGDKSVVEILEQHAQTPFHVPRFGGGLPPRGDDDAPPPTPAEQESVYLAKLLEAYAHHLGSQVAGRGDLAKHPQLESHYERQRVLFYSAESLRNFARDRTPPRTFASLQDDVFHGVIDTCESDHPDALVRVRAAISTAAQVDVTGNALAGVTKVADKQGICHQLANDGRLMWMKKP